MAKQAVCAIGRDIIAHALDYDAGVLPCSSLLPHARDLDQKVLLVVAATFDKDASELTPDTIKQLRLPTRFAGLQVDMPSHIVPLAWAARLVEAGPCERAAIASWAVQGQDVDSAAAEPKRFDGVDEAISSGLLDLLKERGVAAITKGGRPSAHGERSAEDPLRPAMPEKHLLGAYLRHSAAQTFHSMLVTATGRDRVRLLSASGTTAGASLACELSVPGVAYTDRQWAEVLRWRLGIDLPSPPGSRCRKVRATDEEPCNEEIDAQGDHSVNCKCGPFRNFRHNDVAEVYADIIEEVGGYSRREVFVPEFSTNNKEAWLDVWGYGVPELPDCLLDITVRHPVASRYLPGSAQTAGGAAQAAEAEKREKYPARGGRCMRPVVHETWGRLGAAAEDFLQYCSAAAVRRSHRRGRNAGNCLRRWRAQLDAALMRGIAAQLSSARFGVPGRARKRRRPEQAGQLEARCPLGSTREL